MTHVTERRRPPLRAQIVGIRGESFVVIPAVGERVEAEKEQPFEVHRGLDRELTGAAEANRFGGDTDRLIAIWVDAGPRIGRVGVDSAEQVRAAAIDVIGA